MTPDAVVAPPLEEVVAPRQDPRAIDGVLQLHAHPIETGPPGLADSVAALPGCSRFPVWSVNTRRGFPSGLAELRFRAIVLHYTLFYSEFAPLTRPFRAWLAERGPSSYVIAMFQDEQSYTRRKFEACDELGIDSVYTCFRPPEAQNIYGEYTNVGRVVSYHPAYVGERLMAAAAQFAKPDSARRIDVGYRGRRAPLHWGPAAAEKWQIGDEFKRRAAGRGLVLDIEVDESKRIYGDRWYRFIADCKSTLGTESGTSSLDVEGLVPVGGQEMGARVGEIRTRPASYRAISPRHLEAAAFRSCQILYEGDYSGVLVPGVHYIPLRKDFSNFDEVIAQVEDDARRQELASNAAHDLIDSGALSYARFVRHVDDELAAAGVEGTAAQDEVASRLYPSRLARRSKAVWLAARHGRFPGREPVARLVRSIR